MDGDSAALGSPSGNSEWAQAASGAIHVLSAWLVGTWGAGMEAHTALVAALIAALASSAVVPTASE